jgi:hypoxanthine-guanine phosphoribosyltransferase
VISAAPLPAVRVIVQFNQPVAFQSAYFLQKLQVQTQAQVHYLGGISQDTHVYGFQLQAGQTYAQLLQRLGAMPEVARVELDPKAKAN